MNIMDQFIGVEEAIKDLEDAMWAAMIISVELDGVGACEEYAIGARRAMSFTIDQAKERLDVLKATFSHALDKGERT